MSHPHAFDASIKALILTVADALLQAEPGYWRRRADEFEAARPRPGDYTGRLSPERIQAIDERLAAKAQACRNHATLLASHHDERVDDTVLEVYDIIVSHRATKKAEDAA